MLLTVINHGMNKFTNLSYKEGSKNLKKKKKK